MTDKKNTDQHKIQEQMNYCVPMQSTNVGDEIDLLELWNTIWSQRKVIFISTFMAAVLSIIVSLLLPNYYKAEVLLAPVSSGDKSQGLSSSLGGLGGLASLAGINIRSGTNVEESLSVLKSKRFIWGFIEQNNLMPILFENDWDKEKMKWIAGDPAKQPSSWDAYRAFVEDGILSAELSKESGLIKLSIEWIDPALASIWANKLVSRLNNILQIQAIERSQANLIFLNAELAKHQVTEFQQTLYTLIAEEQRSAMLANTQKNFAFRVIDPAVAPDKKSKPKRSIIVILSTFLAGALSVFIVLIRNSILSRVIKE